MSMDVLVIIFSLFPVCSNKLELGYIMDVSGSMGEDNYRTQREFVKNVTKTFNISPQHTQVGVITFSDDAFVSRKLLHTGSAL